VKKNNREQAEDSLLSEMGIKRKIWGDIQL
jgi:hypothetical protein